MGGKAVLGNMVIEITAEADGFNKAVQDTQNKIKQATKNIDGTTFSMTELNNALEVGKKAFEMVQAAIDQTVGVAVDYNKQVREMGQLTGLGAEETSRLIQVTDDWGISSDAATAAMEMMNKKGITPSIDNLAKIADEYMNATDKSAFAEMANAKYGRSFSTLIPILAQGGQALRDQAAAVNDNMVATDESIAKSREYEVALDNLNDMVTGLKYELGNSGLLQVMIDVIKATNDGVVAMENDIDIRRLSENLVEDQIITEKERQDLLWKILIGETTQAEAAAYLAQQNYQLNGSEEKLVEAHNAHAGAMNAVTTATTYGVDSITTFGRELDGKTRGAVANAVTTATDLATAFEGIAKGLLDSDSAMRSLADQGVKALTDSYGDQMRIMADINRLQGNITQAEYDQIYADSYQIDKMGALNQMVEEGKVSRLEYTAILSDGVITQEEMAEAMRKTAEETQKVADSVNRTAEALAKLDGMTVEAWIKLNTEVGAGAGGSNVEVNIALAEGGSFWADQPTLMMVGEGREREYVSVTPESKMGAGAGDTIIINDRLAYKMWKNDRDRETRKRLEAIL